MDGVACFKQLLQDTLAQKTAGARDGDVHLDILSPDFRAPGRADALIVRILQALLIHIEPNQQPFTRGGGAVEVGCWALVVTAAPMTALALPANVRRVIRSRKRRAIPRIMFMSNRPPAQPIEQAY